MSRWDVLVLGGGPAGAALAAFAAGAGARVAVLERESFPRDKVCGEFVSAEGVAVLARLGIADALRGAGATPMDACRIRAPNGRSITTRLPDIPGVGRDALGVSRSLLDATLLDFARRRGAKIFDRLEAFAPIDAYGRVTGVRVRQVGTEVYGEAMTAPIVVAADGRRSLLVRKLHPRRGDPSHTTPRSWFGLKTHLAGSCAQIPRQLELVIFKGGYAGIGAVEGDRINLCILATVRTLRECGGSPERLCRERLGIDAQLRDFLERSPSAGGWKSVGPLRFNTRRPTAAGALFVGDAAGTIDPFSGEGIANALRSAELAAPIALAAAEHGGLSAALARRYRRAWNQAFARVTRRVRLIGFLFERPALAGPALSLLSRGGGGAVAALVAATRSGRRD